MAAIVGEAGLVEADRRALEFARQFEDEFVRQGERRRSLDDTLAEGWRLLETIPREELTRIADTTWATRKKGAAP